MNDKRWERIEALFFRALEVPTEDRDSFLARECENDEELRTEVEAMLRSEDEGRGLTTPFGSGHSQGASQLLPGTRLGPFVIIRFLSSGGMGEVYLAERQDAQYRQDVAIKVLRGDLAVPELAGRFKAERQILARLQHPAICTLLDGGGTEDGRPYLVMQFEAGRPITTFCDEHRLSVSERLELFAEVCDAVQYAHTNLVVHRDIKPSNVVVDSDGQPKLLDFGIAKILEADPDGGGSATVDLRMLTPEHAAPEQITGDPITTGTDVYALGILLYQLLAGAPPFRVRDTSPVEFHRKVCEEVPQKASEHLTRVASPTEAHEVAFRRRLEPNSLVSALRGDLDQIVAMALRKEPERRYGSAALLAEDVRRYLANLPVRAQPDRAAYRVRKFVSRHRTGVAVAAAFFGVVTTSAVALAVQSARIAEERDRATLARDEAEEVSEFMVGLFEAADPTRDTGNPSAVEILERGVASAEELEEQPEVRARMLYAMGRAYMNLGRYEESDPLLRESLALRRETLGNVHADVAESIQSLSDLTMRWTGDFEASEELTLEHLEILVAVHGSDSPELALPLNDLGTVRFQRRDFDGAIEMFEEATRIHRLDPDKNPSAHGGALINLGLSMIRAGSAANAIPVLEEALELNRFHQGDDHPVVATTLNVLGDAHAALRRLDEAESLFSQVLERRTAQLGPQHPTVAAPLNNLSQVAALSGDYEKASNYGIEALAIMRNTLSGDHPRLALVLKNTARNLFATGRLEEAEDMLLESTAIYERRFGPDHIQVYWVAETLVDLYEAMGRPDDADRYREAASKAPPS